MSTQQIGPNAAQARKSFYCPTCPHLDLQPDDQPVWDLVFRQITEHLPIWDTFALQEPIRAACTRIVARLIEAEEVQGCDRCLEVVFVQVPQPISSSGVAARDLASMSRRDSAGDTGVSLRNRNDASGVREPSQPRANLWDAAQGDDAPPPVASYERPPNDRCRTTPPPPPPDHGPQRRAAYTPPPPDKFKVVE